MKQHVQVRGIRRRRLVATSGAPELKYVPNDSGKAKDTGEVKARPASIAMPLTKGILECIAAVIAFATILLTTVPNASIQDLSASYSRQERQIATLTIRKAESNAEIILLQSELEKTTRSTNTLKKLSADLQAKIDSTQSAIDLYRSQLTDVEIAQRTINADILDAEQKIQAKETYEEGLASSRRAFYARLLYTHVLGVWQREYWDGDHQKMLPGLPPPSLESTIVRAFKESRQSTERYLNTGAADNIDQYLVEYLSFFNDEILKVESWKQSTELSTKELAIQMATEGLGPPVMRDRDRREAYRQKHFALAQTLAYNALAPQLTNREHYLAFGVEKK